MVYVTFLDVFIRTTRRKNRDGSSVAYYQLVHNVWDPETKRPIARIIHNFGGADLLDKGSMMCLGRSIARVCGVELRVGNDTPRGLVGVPAGGTETSETSERGSILVAEAIWERLGIGKILREVCKRHGYGIPYERAVFAMTANRHGPRQGP